MNGEHHVRTTVKAALGALAAIGLVAVGAAVQDQRTRAAPETSTTNAVRPAANAAPSPNERWLLDPDGHQATSGVSYVISKDPADKIRLRDRPHGTLTGQTTGLGIVDEVDQGTKVSMRCWIDGGPGDGPSRRWFWVTEAPGGSPHPGTTGYVWADLVWDQIKVPACAPTLTEPANPLSAAEVTLSRGRSAPHGFYYIVQLRDFPAGWRATVQCLDSSDPNDVFAQFTLTADASGASSRDDGCYSAVSGGHWVFADGVQSNKANWSTIAPGPGPDPKPETNRPEPNGGTGPPDQPGDGEQGPPEPPPNPQPPSRTIVVDNRVTNGPAAMREDDVPAYLSTQTRPTCRLNGCMIEGTMVGSGASMLATCQTHGSRMTNGQDNSSVDDANPGLYTSNLWYGVRWPDGRLGFISEIFIRTDHRGGLGLPGC